MIKQSRWRIGLIERRRGVDALTNAYVWGLALDLKGKIAGAGCVIKGEVASHTRADQRDIASTLLRQCECSRCDGLGIVEAAREADALERAGEESAGTIGRGQDQVAPAQIGLGKLNGRIAVIKAGDLAGVALPTEQATGSFCCRLLCLLDSIGGEDAPRSAIKDDHERSGGANHIDHDVDIIRGRVSSRQFRGRKEHVQSHIIFLASWLAPSRAVRRGGSCPISSWAGYRRTRSRADTCTEP